MRFCMGFFILKKSNKNITFVLKSSELIRLLKRDGWIVVRQNGSHLIMVHPVKSGKIVCPNHGSQEIGKGLERKIKRDAGIK